MVALCCALALEHRGRPVYWCSHGAVMERLPGVSIDQLDAAIARAVALDLVWTGGRPPHSLLLRPEGHALVDREAG